MKTLASLTVLPIQLTEKMVVVFWVTQYTPSTAWRGGS